MAAHVGDMRCNACSVRAARPCPVGFRVVFKALNVFGSFMSFGSTGLCCVQHLLLRMMRCCILQSLFVSLLFVYCASGGEVRVGHHDVIDIHMEEPAGEPIGVLSEACHRKMRMYTFPGRRRENMCSTVCKCTHTHYRNVGNMGPHAKQMLIGCVNHGTATQIYRQLPIPASA